MPKPSAPALQRGIQILRALEKDGPLTLDEVTQRVPIPKSSALRFLETLTAIDLVSRNDRNRTYIARVVLVPTWRSDARMTALRQKAMEDLATRANRTVEWYVPGNAGLVLVERAEPERAEVRIGATVGFIRKWGDELEAVSCLGYAWARSAPRPTRLWTYVEDGAQDQLPMKETRARVGSASSDGMVRDIVYNTNGVRRVASVVLSEGTLAGILAVAEHTSQSEPGMDVELPSLLHATAEKLGDGPLPPLPKDPVSGSGVAEAGVRKGARG